MAGDGGCSGQAAVRWDDRSVLSSIIDNSGQIYSWGGVGGGGVSVLAPKEGGVGGQGLRVSACGHAQ